MNEIEFAAVGVTFENRQDLLKDLYSDMIKQNLKNIPVKLVKQENNPYDKNAISINLNTGEQIGYVSKEINEELGTMLDKISKSYIEKIYMNKKRIFNVLIKAELV